MGAATEPNIHTLELIQHRVGGLPVVLPFVTVVVTLYNYERYVSICLKSIAAQTFRNFKCVVVDDASTDSSAAVVERFIQEAEPGIDFILVRHDSNLGQMGAFKTGLLHADGEFLVYVDADDILLPEFLEHHLAAHLSGMPVAFTSSDQYQINEHGEVIGGLHPDLLARGKYRMVFPHHVFSNSWVWATTSSMMFRRSVLELILPDDTDPFRRCADNFVCLFANMVGRSALLPEVLGCYRRHGRNYFSNNRIVGGRHPTGDMRNHPPYGIVRRTILEHLRRNPEPFIRVLNTWSYLRLLGRSSTLRETIGVCIHHFSEKDTEIPHRLLPAFLVYSLIYRLRWRLCNVFNRDRPRIIPYPYNEGLS